MMPGLFFLFFFFFILHLQLACSSSSPSPTPCSPEQSVALLHFKITFSVDSRASQNCSRDLSGYPKTESWKMGSDCCFWDGVTCDSFTGHVIGLDLSLSWLIGSVHENSSLFLLHHLQNLNLACNDFLGSQISPKFGKFTNLTYLDLSHGNFTGKVPASLSELVRLTWLTLSNNKFSGQFPDVLGNLSKLIIINLSFNNFSGQFPTSVFNLNGLVNLDFSHNQFQGQFPNQISGLSDLSGIILYNNLLSGRIPAWLFTLPSLEIIDLSHNELTGLIEQFEQPGPIREVDLRDNQIHGPIFSGTSRLLYLDLSNNKISGQISRLELGNLSNLYHLDLSHNLLSSVEDIPSMVNLLTLDLSYNLLGGQLKDLTTGISVFSASNNNLTGVIPPSFCNFSSWSSLDLSHNSLSGNIPQCLVNSSVYLEFLNLAMNNFHGSIGSLTFPNQCGVTALMLNDNQLEGPLPSSLINCQNLSILDVGNNRINDGFPDWSVNFQNLQVLVLRSNRFRGPIGNSSTRFLFPLLRVLDLSHNQFSGILPESFFNHFQAMMRGYKDAVNLDYMHSSFGSYYSITLTVKGVETPMERILSIFTSIDFSNNLFEGEIPKVIGQLKSLRLLNLSRNSLIGEIPSSLGNLSQLESLDLSSNQLLGTIPSQLTSLTFLSVLNLSYNQLVGPIPEGNQFDTFQKDSYIGNLGLCGSPLSNKCDNDKAPPTIDQDENDASSWFDWKIILIGYGSGFVIGISIGSMVFSTGKPRFLVRWIERACPRNVGRLNRGRLRRRN